MDNSYSEQTNIVKAGLTPIQYDYFQLFYFKGLGFSEIARRFKRNRWTVQKTINRAIKKIDRVRQNGNFLYFEKIKLGDPAKQNIAKLDRQCPHCSARPEPRINASQGVRTDLDLLKDKSGGLCHNCGWSY